jgi:hypothetical protein
MDDLFEPDEFGDPSRFLVPASEQSFPLGIMARLNGILGREVRCAPQGPFECRDWWYVPEFNIGCRGFIVDKRDGNIRGLSSHPDISLSQQFTGYDRGFRHDLMDLTITTVYCEDDTVEFLARQTLWHNLREEMGPCLCPSNGDGEDWATYRLRPSPKVRHWNRDEIQNALQSLPFCFRSQRLHPRPFFIHADDLPFEYTLGRGT